MAFGVVCVHLGECLNRRESNFLLFLLLMFSIYFFWFSCFFWFEHLYITLEFGISCCNVFLLAILNWYLCLICLFLFLVFFGKRKKNLFEGKGIEKNVKCFWSFFNERSERKKNFKAWGRRKLIVSRFTFFCVRPPFWRIFIIPSSHLLQIIFLGCKQFFLLYQGCSKDRR